MRLSFSPALCPVALWQVNGGAPGVGATLSPEGGDNVLAPDEIVVVDCVIGLQARAPFPVWVDLFAKPLP